MCHLPTSILTAALEDVNFRNERLVTFVAEEVESAATRALLSDLHRPHSRLFAVQGGKNGLHVFDQTSMTWLFCAKFPIKDILSGELFDLIDSDYF